MRAIGCFEAVKANGIDTIGIEIRDAKGKEETGKISDSTRYYARATLALHVNDPSPNVEILERVERCECNPVLRNARASLLASFQIERKELRENFPNWATTF